MTQSITQQQEMILRDLQSLSSQQQQNVLEFIHFLINKNQAEHSDTWQNEEEDISFYEATKEIAGSLEWGPGDLATNKKYLEDMGK